VRLLLDTHALIWVSEDRLAPGAREAIKEGAEAVVVSAATVWEIEIKRALAKLRAPEDVTGLVDESGFERLMITFEHANEAGRLPLHHGDPFDRMLIAQARVEGLTLATADARLRRYDVPVFEIAPG
jgi:PIN domain nuclease of toxin-antitoxin system